MNNIDLYEVPEEKAMKTNLKIYPKWECTIEKSNNGFIVRSLEELATGDGCREKTEVFEDTPTENDSMVHLLYHLLDYFGYTGASLDGVRIRIVKEKDGKIIDEE